MKTHTHRTLVIASAIALVGAYIASTASAQNPIIKAESAYTTDVRAGTDGNGNADLQKANNDELMAGKKKKGGKKK